MLLLPKSATKMLSELSIVKPTGKLRPVIGVNGEPAESKTVI